LNTAEISIKPWHGSWLGRIDLPWVKVHQCGLVSLLVEVADAPSGKRVWEDPEVPPPATGMLIPDSVTWRVELNQPTSVMRLNYMAKARVAGDTVPIVMDREMLESYPKPLLENLQGHRLSFVIE